ncbi:peroxisomal membrane protein PEX13-like [Nilaparvata lugens]|uniref:peroxisomal membrane protein PEX13-like n=1 Tax=Nilaparvata lugens TaxID=108931 RepID=UPI00193CD72B|nr:peroxisomal membrane protein PEX13-like [Nilaparvata lugens]
MNPSRDPLGRTAIPNNDQPTYGYSPNVVNVPNQAQFQASGKPPPLPPIPQELISSIQQSYHQNNMGYSTPNRYSNYQGYAPLYNNMYSGYRGLNNQYPFSGYMGNGMPFPTNNPSSPFSSIELFIQTVSSLSMMLESTLSATYASMQAIAGVMENCNRLRQYLIDFVKLGFTIQFIRKIINFCKWIVCFIRGKAFRDDETLWIEAESATGPVNSGAEIAKRSSVWPLAGFFGLLIGGPFIIKKLFNIDSISSLNGDLQNSSRWDPNVHGKQECMAIYDFITPQNGCLKLKAGEIIYIPKSLQSFKDWCPAMNSRNEYGIVPMNRLRRVTRNTTDTVTNVTNKNTPQVTKEPNSSQQKITNNLMMAKKAANNLCTHSVDLKPIEEKKTAIDKPESNK